MVWCPTYPMTQVTEGVDVEKIKKENDRLIIKFFGLEKLLQENQDEH